MVNKNAISNNNNSGSNPDYGFEYVVCALGYYGWLRRAKSNEYYDADEIMLCEMDILHIQKNVTFQHVNS